MSDLATEVDALQKQLKDLTDTFTSNKVPNKEFQMVAFSARIKSSFKDIQPWATIVFSDVETNVGVAYHGKTGEARNTVLPQLCYAQVLTYCLRDYVYNQQAFNV